MDTVTRVMSRYVYNINLHDLPLERPSERRQRIRGFKKLAESGERVPIKIASSIVSSPRAPLTRMRSHSGASPQTTTPKHSTASEHEIVPGVARSASDSHLFDRKQICVNSKEKGLTCDEKCSRYAKLVERSKSLENIYRRIESPSFSESSISHSRSPSPTPSSGIENSSLKDSPLHIESCTMSNSETCATRSVIAGGSYRGWSHDSAVILWRRMLGVLGDINFLKDPELHRHVLECVGKIIDDFCKVRDNLGISVDNQSTPSPPTLVPPIYYFAPSLFRAVQLGDEYRVGKLIAYKYISVIFIRRHEISLTPDMLASFYRCLFEGLASKDLVRIFYLF